MPIRQGHFQPTILDINQTRGTLNRGENTLEIDTPYSAYDSRTICHSFSDPFKRRCCQ